MHDGPTFDLFVTVELPRLVGFGHALTGNRHDAWDLAQEALTRLGLRWDRFADEGNPAAYARTTMVRLNIDRLRRLKRERPFENLPDLFTEGLSPLGFDPWLISALDVLTPRQRTAVVLRHVSDLDLAGIAKEMNTSVGTAKSHLSRGLERLRSYASSDPHGLDPEGARSGG